MKIVMEILNIEFTHLFGSSSSFYTATITNMLVRYHKLVYRIWHRLYHLPRNKSRPLFQCHNQWLVVIKFLSIHFDTTLVTIYPCTNFQTSTSKKLFYLWWKRTSLFFFGFSKTFSINSTFELLCFRLFIKSLCVFWKKKKKNLFSKKILNIDTTFWRLRFLKLFFFSFNICFLRWSWR